MPLSIHSALVFDCDGTLVESEMLHAEALRRALSQFGIDMTTDEVQTLSTGVANNNVLNCVADQRGMVLPPDAEAKVEEIALDLVARMAIPVPGVKAVVEKFAAQGVRLAVASNSSRRVVARMLHKIDLASVFGDHIATRDDVNAPKPAPEIYRFAATLLHVPAEKCVAVEDSPVGIRAAHAAGMPTVGYCPGSSIFNRDELIGAGANVVITDMSQLLNGLGRRHR